MYGGRLQIPAASSPQLIAYLQKFKRQALHAKKLSLQLPGSDQLSSWEAPLPEDFTGLLTVMQEDAKQEQMP